MSSSEQEVRSRMAPHPERSEGSSPLTRDEVLFGMFRGKLGLS
jgi:hypothetical protein